jgi:uncharacterized protein YigE (DUF2233 family)
MPLRPALRFFAAFALLLPAGGALARTAVDTSTEPDMAVLLDAGKQAEPGELLPGLAYRLIALPDFGLKVHAWTFDQDKFAFRMVMEKAPTGSHARDLIGPAPDVLAINGGFFERDRNGVLTPSGLVIMKGRETSPETSGGGSGIIYWGASGVGIGYRKDLTGHGIMAEAVQVGPVLVDPGGKVSVKNTRHDRQNRSAACLAPGTFTIIAVEGGLSLYQFATLLAAPREAGGLGCDVALNLDGGPSTQASSRAGSQELDVLGGTTVQNALIIYRKTPEP